MNNRILLQADEGMIYTNGETYGVLIWLEEGIDPSTYYQITQEEYDAMFPVFTDEVITVSQN